MGNQIVKKSINNLSVVKKIHVYALMAWNGKDYNEALNLADTMSCEELNSYTDAFGSIIAAKLGIEKYLLNGQEIKMEYLTGAEIVPENYFKNLGTLILQNMSRAQVMTSIMLILQEIHNVWIYSNNVKKDNRDINKEYYRLFQNLPIQMIGLEEVVKDLMFLAPMLDIMGIEVGKMEQCPWGKFIPTEEISEAYTMFCNETLRK